MDYVLTTLEANIKEMYLSWGIYEPEQIELFNIADKLNIWIHIADFESQACERNGLLSIILDIYKSEQEQWEDFGHELAHILFHAGSQIEMPDSLASLQETKANNFALHFCIPTFMVLNLVLPQTFNEAVQFISETFNVTESFAQRKLIYIERQLNGFEFHKAIWENLKTVELI